MVLHCDSCYEQKACMFSKKKCSACELLSLEAVGQFSKNRINNKVVVYSCYNEDCKHFGKLLDENGFPIDVGSMLLEKVVH